jgi:alkanesulfonate monooxygenase SsuD/methylene tetrahydromethanopterin reductase-like flavin-dependent oxidoreductase (luciferase family)
LVGAEVGGDEVGLRSEERLRPITVWARGSFVRFAFNFPIFDHLADAHLLAELAGVAEEAGWDRVLVWDHVNLAEYGFANGGPHVDPWIALALMADRTERIELGTCVTPVPRRRPVKLAREILTLHDLSGGRFVFGAGMGAGESEFDRLGELQALFAGDALDHHGDHYTVVSDPLIDAAVDVPIVVAGTWPNPKPFTRAARFDGVYAVRVGWVDPLGPDDVAAICSHVSDHRTSDAPFELAVTAGISADESTRRRRAAELEAAGATVWVEGTIPRFESLDDARKRIRRGPPRP